MSAALAAPPCRYPKHVWPTDPLNTEATRLTKAKLVRRADAGAGPPPMGVPDRADALSHGRPKPS